MAAHHRQKVPAPAFESRTPPGLEQPTEGQVCVDGTELSGSETAVTRLRRERIGFVFQQFNCCPR
jgi:ABC-type methionine transport system ATPase subunit